MHVRRHVARTLGELPWRGGRDIREWRIFLGGLSEREWSRTEPWEGLWGGAVGVTLSPWP